jgi:hypothetical protein
LVLARVSRSSAAKRRVSNLVRVSKCDGSSIFYELGRGDPTLAKPSPRTLVLLYASDLVFRLRWEIQPALQQG